MKLEVCIYSAESAINDELSLADRIELCAGFYEGGITPSYGTIALVRKSTLCSLVVMIRPRGGDFIYSPEEFITMKKDIQMAKQLGANGIALGILLPDGRIDKIRTKELIESAKPLKTTFHRAFDMCINPIEALEDIIQCGAHTLLTSGQKKQAIDGAELIKELIQKAGNRIEIMPGSGINEHNIQQLAFTTKAKWFHLSAKKSTESPMQFRNKEIEMGPYERIAVDEDKIKRIKSLLNEMA